MLAPPVRPWGPHVCIHRRMLGAVSDTVRHGDVEAGRCVSSAGAAGVAACVHPQKDAGSRVEL